MKSWAAPIARWSGAILLPKAARSASSARVGSAFSLSHLLMKKHAAVLLPRASATACSRPASTPPVRVHHEDRAVGRLEAGDHLGDEVEVAGRVQERDARPVGLERRHREAERLAPLLLLGLEVEVGRAVIDLAEPGDGACSDGGAVRRASSCRHPRALPGRRSEGGGGRCSSWSWAVRSSFRRAGRKGVRP